MEAELSLGNQKATSKEGMGIKHNAVGQYDHNTLHTCVKTSG